MKASRQRDPGGRRVPRATYRLQFNEHFKLRDGLALVPYLHALGISHIYASPLFKARPHSAHGYDVCDFNQLNSELGTEADLEALAAALHHLEMGLIVDIVPNHMGIGTPENRWWWDVLTFGAASRFAGHFDIDWKPSDPRLRGKVLVPVLAEDYGKALKRGELRLVKEHDELVLRYHDSFLPVTPGSLSGAPDPKHGKPNEVAAEIEEINDNPEALDGLLRQQHYVLTESRHADAGLNYRRFFSVTTLAGLRVEDGRVFEDVHGLLRRWLKRGWVDGFRVDHPDGLRDPGQYLQRLRELAPDAWIVVEKIVQPDEALPGDWPVEGTTGYDFLNQAAGLFIDPDGQRPLTDYCAKFTNETTDYAELALEKKRLVLREPLTAEVNRLMKVLMQIGEIEKRHPKFEHAELREALIEFGASLPVYRTYVRPESGVVSMTDAGHINAAAMNASRQRRDLAPELFVFLRDLLLLKHRGAKADEFVARFQQLTGAVMAKGVEDTMFYTFNRLVALNEVGGNPGRFGVEVRSFHAGCGKRAENRPMAMLATSTHDTKRSEDVRARLSLLSEIPEKWGQTVRHWAALNERQRHAGRPDRNAEYHFYQTLVGAWPMSIRRAMAYMLKVARESNQYTSWNQPDAEYETALRGFVTGALGNVGFRRALETFLEPLIEAGCINSLAQTLLKLTAPGVPDIYQGTELWDFSLVDPDNRRAVDFALRQQRLAEAMTLPVEEIWRRRSEGLPKIRLIQLVLSLRSRQPRWFDGSSGYQPLKAGGAKAWHVVAFLRGKDAITIVPRLVLRLGGDWADTSLAIPRGEWRNVITGEKVQTGTARLAGLLQQFPVALLSREEKA